MSADNIIDICKKIKSEYAYQIPYILDDISYYNKQKVINNLDKINYILLTLFTTEPNIFKIGEFNTIIYNLHTQNTLDILLNTILSWEKLTIENLCDGLFAIIDNYDISCIYLKKIIHNDGIHLIY